VSPLGIVPILQKDAPAQLAAQLLGWSLRREVPTAAFSSVAQLDAVSFNAVIRFAAGSLTFLSLKFSPHPLGLFRRGLSTRLADPGPNGLGTVGDEVPRPPDSGRRFDREPGVARVDWPPGHECRGLSESTFLTSPSIRFASYPFGGFGHAHPLLWSARSSQRSFSRTQQLRHGSCRVKVRMRLTFGSPCSEGT
jgi:hypothetical protein